MFLKTFGSSSVSFNSLLTAAVAYWLEHPPREQEVLGLIPGCKRPKFLKRVVVAFPLGAQGYQNSTTTGPPESG